MDPQAALDLYRESIEARDDDGANEAARTLRTWTRRGGFPPAWTDDERRAIIGRSDDETAHFRA